jgi:phosphatidylglycerophosphate synthase
MKVSDKSPRKTTVYSAGEETFMIMTQVWRAHIFRPLLELLNACRVTPNQLTYLSLLCGVAFCVFFSLDTPASQLVAFVMLGLHVFLDGIDGPLARYAGTASNQGSFTDSMSDQLVVAFSTITLIHSGHIGVVPGGLYVFFYTLVVVFGTRWQFRTVGWYAPAFSCMCGC